MKKKTKKRLVKGTKITLRGIFYYPLKGLWWLIKKLFSLICAISCSVIWGTSFVAQDMGMDYIGPYTFAASRLLLGFLALLPFPLTYLQYYFF